MTTLPSGALLLDTGIYIRFSREEDYFWLKEGRTFRRTILTAVVAAELYAGTHSRRGKRALDELCEAYQSINHFSSPTVGAWIDAGLLLSRSTLGQMEFVHHFRDLLIAVEAARAGATVITENVRDFERWRALLASSGRKIKLFNPA